MQRKAGSLRLASRYFQQPGDEFSRLKLSTYMWTKRSQCIADAPREELLARIEQCELAIGVVAEPSFDADPRFSALVFEIAARLEGVVFNGHQMIDALGNVISELR